MIYLRNGWEREREQFLQTEWAPVDEASRHSQAEHVKSPSWLAPHPSPPSLSHLSLTSTWAVTCGALLVCADDELAGNSLQLIDCESEKDV